MSTSERIWQDARTLMQTPRDLLRFAMTRFGEAGLHFGHGFPTALAEARYLIAHRLHLAPGQAEHWLDARLTPDEVAFAGDGDMDMGHKVLDEFVRRTRAATIKTLQKLPGPKND